MQELHNKKLLEKSKILFSNILELKKLDINNNFCSELLDWFNEVVLKNISIYASKSSKEKMDQELYKKNRQNVYWINFGRNIGSEFQDYHYALVIYESKYTALVVPLTSKKDHTPKWIEENKEVIVDIGKIEGYPDDSKECYACTFMIQSVSKKRLDRCGYKKDGYFQIKVTDKQMKMVCDKISEITYNKITKGNIDN